MDIQEIDGLDFSDLQKDLALVEYQPLQEGEITVRVAAELNGWTWRKASYEIEKLLADGKWEKVPDKRICPVGETAVIAYRRLKE